MTPCSQHCIPQVTAFGGQARSRSHCNMHHHACKAPLGTPCTHWDTNVNWHLRIQIKQRMTLSPIAHEWQCLCWYWRTSSKGCWMHHA